MRRYFGTIYRPILPDIVSYGFAVSEDRTLWGDLERAVKKDLLPYIDPHAFGVHDAGPMGMSLTRGDIRKLPEG